jgi:hypothetical protein
MNTPQNTSSSASSSTLSLSFSSNDVQDYYHSLSELEQEGYKVATRLLGDTFDVVKTRGYLAFQQQQQEQEHPTKKRKDE